MGDAEMQSSDREGDLFPGPEKEEAGAGGDPQDLSTSEDQFENLTQDVTQGPPPPKKSESGAGSDVDEVSSQDVVQSRESKHKESESVAGSDVDGVSNQDVMQSRESKPRESGSGAGSDEDKVSNEALCISLCSKFWSVSQSKSPATGEFLKAMAGPAEAFAHLQASYEKEVACLKAENQQLQQKVQEQAQVPQESEVARQKAENQRLQQKVQEQAQMPHDSEVARQKAENQRLQQKVQQLAQVPQESEMARLKAENQQLQQEIQEQAQTPHDSVMARQKTKNQQLQQKVQEQAQVPQESEMARQKVEIQGLQQKVQEQAQVPQESEMAHLRAEIQRLQQKVQQLAQASQEMAWLRAQNQQLQQELQEAKRNQWNQFLPKFKTDFHIQVHATGKTGGCEKEFLKKVSEGLSKIHLKPERYQEGSGHFLLVFCPVASRMGTDMENALEGLQGEPKAVLVVMHHISKECNLFVDTKVKAHHPAVVCTVHVRFTIQEGFYACPMNEEAVANVAEVLEEHIKAGKRDLAISGAPSKSQNL